MRVYIVFIADDPYCGEGFILDCFDSEEKARKYVAANRDDYTIFNIVSREVL